MNEQIQGINQQKTVLENQENPRLKMLIKWRDEVLHILNEIKDEPDYKDMFEQFSDGLETLNIHIRNMENKLEAHHKTDTENN